MLNTIIAYVFIFIFKNLLKKIFLVEQFSKKLIIGFVGLITHRTFRGKRFEIKGSKNLVNLPALTYFLSVIIKLISMMLLLCTCIQFICQRTN